MAIRGENIGTAYIKVIADGDDIDGEGIGKKAAKDFDKGWTQELKKRLDDDKTLQQAIKRQQSAIKGQTTKTTNEIVKGIRRTRFEADLMAKSLRDTFDTIHQADRDKIFDLPQIQATRKEVERFRPLLRGIGKMGDENEARFKRLVRIPLDGWFKGATDESDRLYVRLKTVNAEWNVMGDRIGRAFGKGGRNDFVNLMGIFIGRLASLPGVLVGIGGSIAKFFGGIADAFSAAGGGASGMLAGFGRLAGPLAAFAIGITGLTLVVGSFVSIMSLAAGIVVALASSLTFALAGAIGVVAGAFVPLVAAVGVAILAFKNMDAEQKRAFKGVGAAFKDLGQSGADSMFDAMGDSIGNLTGVIKQLEPVVDGVAGALGGVFLSWIDGLQSPATSQFLTMLSNTLPRMVTSLGAIFGNMGAALAGVWKQATPFVQEFLSWLTGVTNQWAIFAGSTLGGEKITTFFNHMRTSLISVSGFLGEVTGLIGDLLSAGRGTGDSIFDSMTTAVEGWRAALAADPDILGRWFTDAEKFAGTLGDIVGAMGRLIDMLDSPETREFANLLGTVLVHSLNTLTATLGPIVALFNQFDGSVKSIIISVGLAALAFNKFAPAVQGVFTRTGTLAGNLRNVETRMTALRGIATTAAGVGGLALFSDGVTRTNSALGILETGLGGAATGFAVGGPWGAAIGGAAGLAIGVANNIKHAGDASEEAGKKAAASRADWHGLVGTLDQVTGAAGEMTRAFIYDKLQKDGTLEQYNKLGVASATVVDAYLGQEGAIKQVNTAQNDLSRSVSLNRQKQKEAHDAYVTEAAASHGVTTQRLIDLKHAEERAKALADADQAVIDKIKAGKTAMDEEADALRKRSGAIGDWAKKLKGVPRNIITRFQSGNIPTTLREVGKLANLYDLTKKDVKTIIKHTFPNKSPQEVQKFLDKLYLVGKQHPNPKITVDQSDAVDGINQVNGLLDGLPDSQNIELTVEYRKMNNPPPGVPRSAAGEMIYGPSLRLVGEAGPEAIVPLNRNLSKVDPAVRELSAIAQGLKPGLASGGVATSPSIGEMNVYTNVVDPRAVASEVLNRLVATGY